MIHATHCTASPFRLMLKPHGAQTAPNSRVTLTYQLEESQQTRAELTRHFCSKLGVSFSTHGRMKPRADKFGQSTATYTEFMRKSKNAESYLQRGWLHLAYSYFAVEEAER